jgi:hypothetical protein
MFTPRSAATAAVRRPRAPSGAARPPRPRHRRATALTAASRAASLPDVAVARRPGFAGGSATSAPRSAPSPCPLETHTPRTCRPKGSSKGPATRYLLLGQADMPRTTDRALTRERVNVKQRANSDLHLWPSRRARLALSSSRTSGRRASADTAWPHHAARTMRSFRNLP